MTKKQCGIIFTLLGLILCTGLLAVKLNNGQLNDPSDLSQVLKQNPDTVVTSSEGEEDTETMNQQKYFYDLRSIREQQDSETIQSLNAIMSDQNTSEEQKGKASEELTKKTMVRDNQAKIELEIKNKGFEDAFCMLDNNKAKITVKSSTGLEEDDSVAIQEIVQDVSNIKDVVIEVQK